MPAGPPWLLAPFAGLALAAGPDRATRDEVVERVETASRLLARLGEAALEIMRDPQGPFVWKDSYVFVVDCAADLVLANPLFPQREGGDIRQHADFAGYRYGNALCETAARPGGGWVEYTWQSPANGLPSRKASYVRSVPGRPMQVGAGVHAPSAPSDGRPGS